jgi:hypothetical protein
MESAPFAILKAGWVFVFVSAAAQHPRPAAERGIISVAPSGVYRQGDFQAPEKTLAKTRLANTLGRLRVQDTPGRKASAMSEQDTPSTAGRKVECKAALDPILRYHIIPGVMLLGFGIYCLVDATILAKYPYTPLSEDLNAWSTWALNFYGQFIFTTAGIIVLLWGLLKWRRVLVADDNGIGYAGKEKLPWSEIEKLDAGQLKSKGILYLDHPDGTLTLDNWKLKNFRELVAVVERNVPDEKQTT